jgi:cation:H+ antiporter
MLAAIGVVVAGALLFAVGLALTIWASRRFAGGLGTLAQGLGLSTYAAGALLAGFRAGHIAVGLAAANALAAPIALGVIIGGAIFLLCVPLGMWALRASPRASVRVPGGYAALLATAPLAAGLPLLAPTFARFGGLALLCLYVVAVVYVTTSSGARALARAKDAGFAPYQGGSLGGGIVRAILGMIGLGVGGAFVTQGAVTLALGLDIAPLLMGMIVVPAALGLVMAPRRAYDDGFGYDTAAYGARVADALGAQLNLLLFGLGLLALLALVAVDPLVRRLDWPFLVGASWLVALALWRGRMGRLTGAILVVAYVGLIVLHILARG